MDKYTDTRSSSRDIVFKVQNEAAYIVLEEYLKKKHNFALIISEKSKKGDFKINLESLITFYSVHFTILG